MHIFLFVKNSASFNFFIAHSYFLSFWLFCFGLRFNQKKRRRRQQEWELKLEIGRKYCGFLLQQKWILRFDQERKRNFPRRSISHCCFFLAQREATTLGSQSVFHTWFTPKLTLAFAHTRTNTNTHTHRRQHSLALHWMITPHIPVTLSTFDFISFSFCVYFSLDIKMVLFILLLLHGTITWYYFALNPYLWYIFWGHC